MNPIDKRISDSLEILSQAYSYSIHSRTNVRQYWKKKRDSKYLENALNDARKALEGYYETYRCLYGILNIHISLFKYYKNNALDINNRDTQNKSHFLKLKQIEKIQSANEPTVNDCEAFFKELVQIPGNEMAVASMARTEGNLGSHFNSNNKLDPNKVDKVCNSLSGIIQGLDLYLKSENIQHDKSNIDIRANAVLKKLEDYSVSLVEKSYWQCQQNKETIDYKQTEWRLYSH